MTKFIVALDGGGELTVVQQNLETSSEDVHEMERKRVRLRWSPDVEFVIQEEETVKRIRFGYVALAALVAALAVPAAGVSKGTAVPTSVGAGEGKLTLVAWEGYTEKQWVAPFEKATGCKVSAKYAGSSNDMFNLMTSGGGGQYDMVSASGDASLRLIYAGAVPEVERRPDPVVQGLLQGVPVAGAQHGGGQALRHLAAVRPERADGQHEAYGKAPTSWAAIYDAKNKGKITIPDNPIQIADAALYLSKTKPVARDQGPVRADEGAARRGRGAAQAAAAARQEVLGPRVRPDRPVQERRLDDRRLVAVSGQRAEGAKRCRSSA